MVYILTDSVVEKINIAAKTAIEQTSEACIGLRHMRKNVFAKNFRAYFEEALYSMFPGSVRRYGEYNYHEIKLTPELTTTVLSWHDAFSRKSKKSEAFEMNLNLFTPEELDACQDIHKGELVFQIANESICRIIIRSRSGSFQFIEIPLATHVIGAGITGQDSGVAVTADNTFEVQVR